MLVCTCSKKRQWSIATTQCVNNSVAQGMKSRSNSFPERPAEGNNVGDDDQTSNYAQYPIQRSFVQLLGQAGVGRRLFFSTWLFCRSKVAFASFLDPSLNHHPINLQNRSVVTTEKEFFGLYRYIRRLRVFENRVLRRIFGPRRGGVTGEWRKLHNDELIVCTSHPILFG